MESLLIKTLLLIFFVLLFSLIVLLFNFWQSYQHSYQEILKKIIHLRQDLRTMSLGELGVGDRVVKLENELKQILEQQDFTEKRNINLSSYSHAAKMVEMGANLEDLVTSCGLSKAEANAVIMLNKSSYKNIKKL